MSYELCLHGFQHYVVAEVGSIVPEELCSHLQELLDKQLHVPTKIWLRPGIRNSGTL
jgi:hypothetical protein